MLAIHARYRGREKRRGELVRRSAEALSRLPGVHGFHLVGAEDIRSTIDNAEALTNVVMAFISDGQWAVGLGIGSEPEAAASRIVGSRAGTVRVQGSSDVEAAFSLLSHVLSKRTPEGREATSLVRRGMTQNEAAEVLGISKQAMSQRLQAAGWAAESAGWQLAVNLIEVADSRS